MKNAGRGESSVLIKTDSALREFINDQVMVINNQSECNGNIKVLILCPVKDKVEMAIANRIYYSEENIDEIAEMIDDIESGKKTLENVKEYENIVEKRCIKCGNAKYQIQCLLLNQTVNYDGLIQFLLEEISNEAEYQSLRDKAGLHQMFEHKNLNSRTLIMNKYVQFFLNKENLPTAELLIELSAQKYEGSESEARIYFDNGDIKGIDTVCVFDKVGEEQRRLVSEKLRTIRKLMEMSKRKAMYLLADDNMCITSMISIDQTDDQGKVQPNNYVCFSGYMQWSVCIKGREEVCYKQGKYHLNSSEGQDIYEMEVDKFKNREGLKKLDNLDSVIETVENLVGILKKQRHGTAVILTDDEIEASRLCQVDRGILIKQEDEQCFTLSDHKFDEEKILSVTEIDGALFMNLEGKCTAFGVIVDGIATQKGNPGRGARYNSIFNYIRQKKNDKTYIALIFSEDGGVDIIDNFR